MAKEQDTSPFKGVSCTKMGLSSLSGTPCTPALSRKLLVQGGVFTGEEMLDTYGVKARFSPGLGRSHVGLGSTVAGWHGGQSSAAVKHPSESNTQQGVFPASADPLKNPTRWRRGECAVPLGVLHLHTSPRVPATLQAYRVLLVLHGVQIDTCFLLQRSRGAQSNECRWGCHIPLLVPPPSLLFTLP